VRRPEPAAVVGCLRSFVGHEEIVAERHTPTAEVEMSVSTNGAAGVPRDPIADMRLEMVLPPAAEELPS
jgi:hypothetical protein